MQLETLIQLALQEDMPHGDITTESLGKQNDFGMAKLIAKEDLILSGQEPFALTFTILDPSLTIHWFFQNGAAVLANQTICTISGSFANIIMAERVALNFVGHLSGIATLTRCYVNRISHTKTKILDTRKTTPLFRDLEKQAVLHGGGLNHRRDLSDGVMLKENHLMLMDGDIEAAVSAIRTYCPGPIILETENLTQIKTGIALGVDRILLDNMSNAMMSEALQLIPQHIETEASGNMSLERVASVAELGVDFISVGALTHSAPSADISLLLQKN